MVSPIDSSDVHPVTRPRARRCSTSRAYFFCRTAADRRAHPARCHRPPRTPRRAVDDGEPGRPPASAWCRHHHGWERCTAERRQRHRRAGHGGPGRSREVRRDARPTTRRSRVRNRRGTRRSEVHLGSLGVPTPHEPVGRSPEQPDGRPGGGKRKLPGPAGMTTCCPAIRPESPSMYVRDSRPSSSKPSGRGHAAKPDSVRYARRC